jgi:hypothetical protein
VLNNHAERVPREHVSLELVGQNPRPLTRVAPCVTVAGLRRSMVVVDVAGQFVVSLEV